MEVIIIMLVGVFVGHKFCSEKYKNIVEKIQFLCVFLLIFLMGVSLGNQEDFISKIVELGLVGLLYAIVPIVFSILVVYMLTKKAFASKGDRS